MLHVPGNYRGGILEMAMVFDCNLPADTLILLARETAAALKQQGEIFRNVRLNTLLWRSDTQVQTAVTAMALLQTGAYFQDYATHTEMKCWEQMAQRLRKFYARSKLILIFTDGNNTVKDREALEAANRPFLEKKLIFLTQEPGEETVRISREINWKG